MKTMLTADLCQIRPTLLNNIAVFVFIGIALALGTGGAAGTAAAIAAMAPYMVMFSLLTTDEAGGWAKMRDTLAVSRFDAVVGRYATVAVVCAASFVGSIAIALIIAAICSALPDSAPTWLAALAFRPGTIAESVLAALLGVACSLVLMALTMPVAMRYGLNRTVRLLPLLYILGFCAVMAFVPNQVSTDPSLIDAGIQSFTGIAFGASVVLFVASLFVAAKLYAGREF